jgi:hypothetical protein
VCGFVESKFSLDFKIEYVFNGEGNYEVNNSHYKKEKKGFPSIVSRESVVDYGNEICAVEGYINNKSNDVGDDAESVFFVVVASPLVVFCIVINTLNACGKGLAHLLVGKKLKD